MARWLLESWEKTAFGDVRAAWSSDKVALETNAEDEKIVPEQLPDEDTLRLFLNLNDINDLQESHNEL
jgi:hypothetical protein